MGTSRWSPEDWDDYASTTAHKSAASIFSRAMHRDLDPLQFTVRESCDSAANPNSTPIIVAIDQTGSMGFLAETLIKQGLGVLLEEIYDRKPVPDPHVMCMAIGDAWTDGSPLQATQFESDIRLADQLSHFFLEGNGGGNNFESYNLPWYFAATRTKCDAMLKRQKKGYLFTVGDEPPPPKLLASHVKQFLGGGLERDLSTKQVLEMASKSWNVFHIMIAEGNYYGGHADQTKRAWQELLSQNAITLTDHTKLAELIVSTLQIAEGADLNTVSASWSGKTELIVREALTTLSKPIPVGSKGFTKF